MLDKKFELKCISLLKYIRSRMLEYKFYLECIVVISEIVLINI